MSGKNNNFSWKWFLVLAAINTAAVVLNHIDDTDETYGYWEPLHYLIYKKGMQTWEYDPIFAIRSYAFIFPFYLLADVFRKLGVEKIALFYGLRALIGLFSTYSQYTFIQAINERYKDEDVAAKRSLSGVTAMFLVLSPGVFFASTSFLPSALSMTLIMLSVGKWLQHSLPESIFWGSVAVLGTGWPFVGLIFLPLGLHMLGSSFSYGGFMQIIKLCLYGILIVILVLLPVTIIDFIQYEEPTIPFWNILTYNTGNRGDELYGIEPASYYVKNLLLTTGLAFPLAVIVPILEIIQLLFTIVLPREKVLFNRLDTEMLTIYASAGLWLIVLFSRPHKEERFLYPVYPLLAFAASRSFLNIMHSLKALVTMLLPLSKPAKLSIGKTLQTTIYRVLSILMLLMFSSRIFANIRNYHGYIATWQDLYSHISQSSEYINLSQAKERKNEDEKPFRSYEDSLRVCVGSEWHLFPTHFFLPTYATLFYIEDGFHGILPQHYEAINGTSRIPPLPNNGENQEEVSRYIDVDECHYVITSKDAQTVANRLVHKPNLADDTPDPKSNVYRFVEAVSSRPVLDREKTTSSIVRAFYLPQFIGSSTSPQMTKFREQYKVVFKPYQILKVVNGGQNTSLKPPKDSSSSTANGAKNGDATAKEADKKKKKPEKEPGVGASLLSSLFGNNGDKEKIQVKNEMTKEQLAARLGLSNGKRKSKKTSQPASSTNTNKPTDL